MQLDYRTIRLLYLPILPHQSGTRRELCRFVRVHLYPLEWSLKRKARREAGASRLGSEHPHRKPLRDPAQEGQMGKPPVLPVDDRAAIERCRDHVERHARVTWTELFPPQELPPLPGESQMPERPRPATLIVEVRHYSCALFDCEAAEYFVHSKTVDELRLHLNAVAERILSGQLRRFKGILSDAGAKTSECKETIYRGLCDRIGYWTNKYEDPRLGPSKPAKSEASQQALLPTNARLSGIVHSPVAARRMENHLRRNHILQREFALAVGCDERTLRRFRKTGKIRRDLLDAVAKNMALSIMQLTSGQ